MIDEKLIKDLKELMLFQHENGSRIEPDWETVRDVHNAICEHYKLNELERFKDENFGLHATDKEPENLFEEVFVNLIEKIGMDGEKTFSAMDFEYYNEYFKKGIKLLMRRIG